MANEGDEERKSTRAMPRVNVSFVITRRVFLTAPTRTPLVVLNWASKL